MLKCGNITLGQVVKGKHVQKNRTNQSLFLIVGLVVVAIALVLMYIVYLMLTNSIAENNAVSGTGSDGVMVINPPQAIPDFTLTNQAGEAIQLSSLKADFTLMNFGYTHCPDVCPATITDMRSIRENLGTDADKFDFVFVSVDGKRDTPQVLSGFFQTLRVDSFMIGMTGTEDDVRAAVKPFGVDFILNKPDKSGEYSVDHTAGMFLLNKNKEWIRRYSFGTTTQRIAEDLQSIQ